MLNPLVSVIMPAYNSSKTISDSILAILNQTYNNFELIIIDDSSIDNTFDIVNDFRQSEPRLSLLKTQSNSGGAAVPRNIGIKVAKGKFIAFCDSDDIWAFNKLEKQIEYSFQLTDNVIICSWFRVISSHGHPVGCLKPIKNIDLSSLLNSNSICLSSAFLPTKLAKEILFKEIGHEDYYFWLSCMRAGASVFCIQDYLVDYRILPGSLSRNKFVNLKYLFFVYRNYNRNFLWAFFRTLLYSFNNYSKYDRKL